ncbi:MAG: malate synthase A [Alphaproteobacteria bacterium]|nr:malate synthase A [Alphaproteobacteria bacterium]
MRIHGKMAPGYEQILSTQAMDFIVGLERKFRPEYKRLLALREERQRRLDAGEKPDFLPETVNIRNGDWTVAPLPRDLYDRRVEIAGPPDRRTVVTALNSGAACYVADFDDATSPTWSNLVEGQINLRDAVAGTIGFKDPGLPKEQRLNPRTAVLIARPRGWHMPERHVIVDGEPIAGALFDFGLYFYHNARPLIRNGSGPYFYLSKLESHGEARLWNEIFLQAQRAFGLPRGTIKVTIMVETLPAAFEMDEILYELRDHAAGLTFGRRNYLFSYVKKLRNDRGKLLPDRAKLAMSTPFLRGLSLLLVKTCHRREVHAIGAMNAQVPVRDGAHETLLRQEKERDAGEGYDGSWIAHPSMVAVAKAAFDRVMPQPNQVARKRLDVQVGAPELLQAPSGARTEAGLRQNAALALACIEAWLRGVGGAVVAGQMEDIASAEAARAQLWQWTRHNARLDDGRTVTAALCRQVIGEETARLRAGLKPARPDRYEDAAGLLLNLVDAPECIDFLTIPAYPMLAD